MFANYYYQNVQITWTVLLKKQQQIVSAKEITIECFKNSLRKFTKTLHKIQNILACGGLFSSLRSHFFCKGIFISKFRPCCTKKIFKFSSKLFYNSYCTTGFPAGVANMGGLLKIWWEGLKSKHGGAWGSLKYCQKIPGKEFIWW